MIFLIRMLYSTGVCIFNESTCVWFSHLSTSYSQDLIEGHDGIPAMKLHQVLQTAVPPVLPHYHVLASHQGVDHKMSAAFVCSEGGATPKRKSKPCRTLTLLDWVCVRKSCRKTLTGMRACIQFCSHWLWWGSSQVAWTWAVPLPSYTNHHRQRPLSNMLTLICKLCFLQKT